MGYANFSGPIPMCNSIYLFHLRGVLLSMGTSHICIMVETYKCIGTFIIAWNWTVHWTVMCRPIYIHFESINCLAIEPTMKILLNATPVGILIFDNFICVIKRIFSSPLIVHRTMYGVQSIWGLTLTITWNAAASVQCTLYSTAA